MTVEQYISNYPGISNVSRQVQQGAIIIRGLNASDDYSADNSRLVHLTVADLLVTALSVPDYKENKLSETFQRKEMRKAACHLYRTHGEPEKVRSLNKGFSIIGRAPNKW